MFFCVLLFFLNSSFIRAQKSIERRCTKSKSIVVRGTQTRSSQFFSPPPILLLGSNIFFSRALNFHGGKNLNEPRVTQILMENLVLTSRCPW